MIENILFDENGGLPVWGVVSTSGKPFYSFKLTDEDEFVMFPNTTSNPKAPKFTIKRAAKREG